MKDKQSSRNPGAQGDLCVSYKEDCGGAGVSLSWEPWAAPRTCLLGDHWGPWAKTRAVNGVSLLLFSPLSEVKQALRSRSSWASANKVTRLSPSLKEGVPESWTACSWPRERRRSWGAGLRRHPAQDTAYGGPIHVSNHPPRTLRFAAQLKTTLITLITKRRTIFSRSL